MNKQLQLKNAVSQILSAVGENTERNGLIGTPDRVAESFKELTSGYGLSASDIVQDAIFPCEALGMVLQKDIEFYSLCEHHLLPFFGHVHVAYIPDRKIIGLSKVGRLIDVFAKRLQVQENLTHQIASALHDILRPKGVAVLIEAQHFCMMMRGVKKQGNITQTKEYRGIFIEDINVRLEFLQAIKK
ncbi:MAG TPA: GTP cyclohydrolase I FolE [Myxococcota bacterium]|nr:GTP cyclohydrolase I FolE [Myxococcota bacterium]